MTITLIFIITKMWSVSIFLCSCSLIASIHPQQSTWISPKSSQRFSPITITKMRSLSTFLCPYSIITSNTLNMDIGYRQSHHHDNHHHHSEGWGGSSTSHIPVPSLPATPSIQHKYRRNHQKYFHYHHLLTSNSPHCQHQWLQSTSRGRRHLWPDSRAEILIYRQILKLKY